MSDSMHAQVRVRVRVRRRVCVRDSACARVRERVRASVCSGEAAKSFLISSRSKAETPSTDSEHRLHMQVLEYPFPSVLTLSTRVPFPSVRTLSTRVPFPQGRTLST
jgi:hypothetical protein